MKNARQILPRMGPWLLVSSGLGILLDILARRFEQNSLKAIWLDESIMVFIANHPPFSRTFFEALKENIAGMPWPFVEYAVFLRLLEITVPLPEVMDHLELFLRLPLTVYSAVTAAAVFLMARRLSKSWITGAAAALFLFVFNYLSQHLGGELRFHTGALAHISLSWCFLGYFLTAGNKKPRAKNFYLAAWLTGLTLSGWSHLYGIYSVFLQGIVFGLAAAGFLPLRRPFEKKIAPKIITLAFVVLTGLGQALFFLKWPPHPYSRRYGRPAAPELFDAAWRIADDHIFYPSLWFWIISLAVFCAIAVRKSASRREAGVKLLVLLLGAAQIALTLLLGMHYSRLNWGPESWGARYTMFGLVPFVFFYSLIAKDVIPRNWDKTGSLAFAVVLILIYICDPGPKRIYGGSVQKLSGHAYQTGLRQDLRRLDAHGRVTAVLGLRPNPRHLDQRTVHGLSMDFTWQIYVKGPFALAPITEYKNNLFGGLRGFPCAAREVYPVATGPAEEFVIDFCDKDRYVMRVLMP
jgi:hypothetical protein